MNETHNNEMAILGTILAGNAEDTISRAITAGVDAQHFTEPARQRIWSAILELFSHNRPVDIMTVCDALNATPGTPVTLRMLEDCIDAAPVRAESGYHIERLVSAALLRRAIGVTAAAHSVLCDSTIDTAREYIAKVQSQICSVEIRELDERDPADIAMQHVETWRDTDVSGRRGIHWPLPKLDHNLGPITDELIVLAALPSCGKTAFALNLAVCSAWAGHRVSFASLESPRDKISERLVSAVTGENSHSLKFRRVLPERYGKALEKLSVFRSDAAPHIGWNFDARTPEQLSAWGRAEVSKGSGLLIVDNTRHIFSGGTFKDMVQEMSQLSKRLKRLRDDIGIATMILHHLSEDLKLKWSRDLQADADIIATLIKDDASDTPDECDLDFRIEKNRDGPAPMTARLRFVKHQQRFEDCTA